MQDRNSFTAETVALMRALETHRGAGRRLFVDPYAEPFTRGHLRLLALSSCKLHSGFEAARRENGLCNQRDKKTKSGVSINPQLAHEIAKHSTILNEAAAQPETKKSIKQFRESIAPFFAKLYGAGKKLTKQNVTLESVKNVRKISRGRTP